jgi:hypothetical protein
MQQTRNQHVSHARLVAPGGSCAPLMPSVGLLCIGYVGDGIHESASDYPHSNLRVIRTASICFVADWHG